MKKGILLMIFAAAASVILYSYPQGAAREGHRDGTGAEGNQGGCGTCHTAGTTDSTKVELDSAGIAVTSYHPGMAYTVKISAKNASTGTYPEFGFQLAAVLAAGAGTSTATNAGTWGATLPTDVQNTAPGTSTLNINIIEHDSPIPATTGTGGNGTTYVESIPWTAPAAGTGSIRLYGIINEVDNNENPSHYQAATAVTITEFTSTPVVASVSIAQTAGTSTICSGSSVTFTATPTNGGTAPAYQWKVNGTAVTGATAATFTTTTLAAGSDAITCVMTSNLSGVTGSPATSNAITITVNASVTPSVSIGATSTTICANQSVTFTATPTNGGSSPTYQWQNNGTAISGATSATYSSSTLANGAIITCVLTSDAACVSPATATSNSITMIAGNTVTPAVSIVSGSGTSVCANQNVTFTATPTNGGSTPVYQWKNNGTAISGATSGTYSSSTLINGAVITCVLTSDAACASPTTATSNALTMAVAGSVTPSVTIVSGSGNSICANQSVTFTATPVNGGTVPTYQWQNDGVDIAGATSSTYTSSALANGNVISVVMTSSSPCASTPTATSNSITMTVGASVTPSVTIVSSGGSSLCANQSTTFTATPVNGGNTPTYQWYKGGTPVSGATSATYTTSTLTNGNIISCILTSDAACASTTTATSNEITISIVSNATPSVSVASNPAGNICPGQSVTFTATPVNGGTAPTYQWYNGSTAISGATGATYTGNSLTNGEVVSCKMVSNSQCVTTTNATSDSVTVTISASVTPAVSIVSNSGSTVCSGQNVSFTATPVNGGATPAYQWYNGGTAIAGATSSAYTSATLANGAVITVKLTSGLSCASPTTATSNAITLSVGTGGTDSVTVTSSAGTTLCSGQADTLIATAVNGGSSPGYQWMLNDNSIIGATSATYIPAIIDSGDVYTVQLTSSSSCATQHVVVSGPVILNVAQGGEPALSISSNVGIDICPGVNVTFNAVGVNGGANPTYQWVKNGTNVGGNSATYANNTLANGDVIGCSMTSSLQCASPAIATSNNLSMTVYSAPVATITDSAGILVAPAANTYQWFLNNISVANGNGESLIPASNGDYTVQVTNVHGCGSISSVYDLTGLGVQQIAALADFVVYPNPVDNTLFVDFTGATGDGKIVTRLLDMNGRILIENATVPVSGEKISLNMAGIANGIYLLQVSQHDVSAYRKVVVGR